MRTSLIALLTAGFVALAGCGGGGSVQPDGETGFVLPTRQSEPGSETATGEAGFGLPTKRPESESASATGALRGFTQLERNLLAFDPMTDLPPNGEAGILVTRPSGAVVRIRHEYADGIEGRLEGPNWASDPDAVQRLQLAALFLETAIWTGYKQWARHLNENQTVDVLVGYRGNERCSHSALACYNSALDKVILGEKWLRDNYWKLHRGQYDGVPGIEADVFSELVYVATHEAAHQFRYRHPNGDSAGCGGDPRARCHGPIGSGSVVSYDISKGYSARYAPDREDVAHIQGGTWNPNATDLYSVRKTLDATSIKAFGYWLEHDFAVSGVTAPGRPEGGTFAVENMIFVQPFVHGTPSADHELRGNATWSGKDNFFGYDLHPEFMVALRADAMLRYTFAGAQMAARLSGFEHYLDGTWRGSSIDDHMYPLACSAGGCSFERAGTPCLNGTATCGAISVQTKFYAHEGDPSGYVGGVVNNDYTQYAGAFVAEKD